MQSVENEIENMRIKYAEMNITSSLGEIQCDCPLSEQAPLRMRVDYKGDIFPCQAMSIKEFSLGNLCDNDLSLETMEARLDKIKSKIEERTYIAHNCIGCPYTAMCAGGCIVENFKSRDDLKYQKLLCDRRRDVCREKVSIIHSKAKGYRNGKNH